jgi:hypothetical protein
LKSCEKDHGSAGPSAGGKSARKKGELIRKNRATFQER